MKPKPHDIVFSQNFPDPVVTVQPDGSVIEHTPFFDANNVLVQLAGEGQTPAQLRTMQRLIVIGLHCNPNMEVFFIAGTVPWRDQRLPITAETTLAEALAM